jgi:hypothetical protein
VLRKRSSTNKWYFLYLGYKLYKLHLRKRKQQEKAIFAIRRLNNAGCQVTTGVLLRAELLCDVTQSRLLNTYRRFEAPTASH